MKKITLFALIAMCSVAISYAQKLPTERMLQELYSDAQFFTDMSYTTLKKGAKVKNIQNAALRAAAEKMAAGVYDTAYRAVSYKAYASPEALEKAIKLGDGFSKYENMTGMYLPAGINLVFVGETHGHEIDLLAPYLMRQPPEGVKPTEDPAGWGLHKQTFALHQGVNIINLERASNVYVSYFDDEPTACAPIKVHFLTGDVNGYFDSATQTNEDWDKLLANAVSPIMDARGRFIQVAYPVEWFKVYTSGKGLDLMAAYDTMLMCQYRLMGLEKYSKLPENRIFARVNFNYYMFRDGDGVAYLGDKGTMRMVADPSVVVSGDPCWGFSHEVGHVMQMRPQLTWGGMTEVSNNIFSLYTSGALGNESRLKNQDSYNQARASIIGSDSSYLHDPNVFNRLVPFWQLHLYFTDNGYPDFYGDVMEVMRSRDDAGRGNESINNQFEFVKTVCDVTETDLIDFFEKWGFFWIGDITVKDYGRYDYKITSDMVQQVKDYVKSKGYDAPQEDITLISE